MDTGHQRSSPPPREDSENYDRDKDPASDFVAAIARRAELYIDHGARQGFHTLLVANSNPKLEIVALEGEPEAFSVLERNVALLGGRRVSLAKDASATVDALVDGRAPCPVIVRINASGRELAVLAGMEETLRRFDDTTLIVEFNPKLVRALGNAPEQVLDKLRLLGFEIFLIREGSRRVVRLRAEVTQPGLLDDAGDAKLYCVKRERALSVCLFAHSAWLSGAERGLLRLVDQLVSGCGAVCTAVVPSAGPLVARLESYGVSCLISNYGWWCAGLGEPHVSASWARQIDESVSAVVDEIAPWVREIDPDVLWTQTTVIPWGAMTAAILAKPHVWNVTEYGEKDHGLKFFWPFEWIVADIVATSATIFAVSHGIVEELFPTVASDKVRVRYPQITIPSQDDAAPDATLFNSSSAIKLGVFAFISPSKGQEDAIRAVAEIAHRHDVELLLAGSIGDQAYRDWLTRLAEDLGISERVHFPGNLAEPYAAMRACDIVLVCSRNEAFGRVAIEASLLRRPVVYAAAGGLLESMIDRETGLAYPPGDTGRLVACLEEIIADPELGRALSENAWLNATTRFGGGRQAGETFSALLALRNGAVPPAVMPRLLEGALKLHEVTAERDAACLALARSEAAFNSRKAKLNAKKAHLRDLLKERDLELQTILQSRSWRATAPFRFLFSAIESSRSAKKMRRSK